MNTKNIFFLSILVFIITLNIICSCQSVALAETSSVPAPKSYTQFKNNIEYIDFIQSKNLKSYFSPYSTSKVKLTMSGHLEFQFRCSNARLIGTKAEASEAFKNYVNDFVYFKPIISTTGQSFDLLSSYFSFYSADIDTSSGMVTFICRTNYEIVIELPCYNSIFNDGNDYDSDYYSVMLELIWLNKDKLYYQDKLVMDNITYDWINFFKVESNYIYEYPYAISFSSLGSFNMLSMYINDVDLYIQNSTSFDLDTYVNNTFIFKSTYSPNSSDIGSIFYVDFNNNLSSQSLSISNKLDYGYKSPTFVIPSEYQNSNFSFIFTSMNLAIPAMSNQVIANDYESENSILNFFNSLRTVQSVEWYDIPGHLNNMVAYLINALPFVDQLYNLALPITNILDLIITTIKEFEVIQYVFTFVICLLVFGLIFKYVGAGG